MGFFKRALSKANEIAPDVLDPGDAIVTTLSPSIRRVKSLEARGTPANGVVTGIKFSLNDETTRKEYAVSVLGGDGTTASRYGVRTQARTTPRLRLGVPVVLKVDGGRGIFDWEAMAAAWGLDGDFFPQESMRRPPDDGIVDTAVDWGVQRHLKKWAPATATVVSLQRCTALGMPTLNWDVELRLADGTSVTSGRDEVPTYAWWWVAPGASVPAVVDPKGSGKASVDWLAFARGCSDDVGFDDEPPAGSIAAEIEGRS